MQVNNTLFLIILSFFNYICAKYIEIYFEKSSGAYAINSLINFSRSLSKKIYINIDLKNPYPIFAFSEINGLSHFTNEEKYTVFSENNIPLQCKKISLPILFSKFEYNFTFYNIINEEQYNLASNTLSLPYKTNRNYSSILDDLFNTNQINDKVFFIDSFYSYLYFGDMEYNDRLKFSSSFSVNSSYDTWGLNLDSVSLRKEGGSFWYFNNQKKYAYLQTSSPFISAPKMYMIFLINQFFNKYFNTGECEKNQQFNIEKIFCKNKLIYTFPNITFTIDDIDISFPLYLLFDRRGDDNYKSEFLMKENTNKDEKDIWVLGTSFMNVFVTKFDKQRSLITLYSDKFPFSISKSVLEYTYENNKNRSILLYSIIMLVLTFGGLLCLCVLYSHFTNAQKGNKYKVINL